MTGERHAPLSQRPDARDLRPMVARTNMGPSTLAIVAGVIIVGVALFAIIDSRRRGLSAPSTFPTISQADLSRSPSPLYIPPEPAKPVLFTPALPQPAQLLPPTPRVIQIPSATPVPAPQMYGQPQQPRVFSTPVATQSRSSGGPAVVIDNSQPRTGTPTGATGGNAFNRVPGVATDRTRSGMLANRSETVPQGSLIQAVLETAFDSTSPGFARALVQRDVRGFDGSRVLIPRGSRLIGEYRSDTGAGQRRVMIVWSRLIRPDGVTMALASPTTDPVGRGGIKAEVDTHFWERFGGAFLQSTLDLGVALAARNNNSPIIVAGSLNGMRAPIVPQSPNIPPTLRVAAGSSISVFVARDLDFSGAPDER